eukprot:CAMPEP_0205911090 /NCGR_PEP_ID=MMETSP1325-20131115/4904_1 /ASSEMBLY_ACC=CAM_ASM_000708 /TAXON_ID=236786 /ORGANISM="Florenciella sp., Strain RCC1007" /LENGTH=34 /DNA_ID= /DNA_START= /DNA_END= /DNA_ORIENTATION=
MSNTSQWLVSTHIATSPADTPVDKVAAALRLASS